MIDGQKIATTKEERIAQLEEQIKASNANVYNTSNRSYGYGSNIERFDNARYNIVKSEDLMLQPRRPAKKNWTPTQMFQRH